MLINREQARVQDGNNYPAPVPGLLGDNIPTTGDVHLYADPGTYYAHKPILFADCEGMAGGESTPSGHFYKEKIERVRKHKPQIKRKLRKPITWANNSKMQSREYAVTTLFPRILYTFSDVVVFILREPRYEHAVPPSPAFPANNIRRTFQSQVLQRLIKWAAMSIDKSINQPSLPHLVIVINATEAAIDDDLWDIDKATRHLLGDYAKSIHEVADLREILARLEENLGKQIRTTKELLEHFYSSVAVVRIPSKGRYMQIDEQVGKLYHLISSRCAKSFAHKEKDRMLLNAEKLPQYVTSAYDHFSRHLDMPFDFAEEARRHTPLPKDFGGHMLNLILSMYNAHERRTTNAKALLQRLCLPIASCIMLAATRDNIQGKSALPQLWSTSLVRHSSM